MPRVRGFLHFGAPGHPDQGLPPGSPGEPDQGLPPEDLFPDQGLPDPPPGVWPPPMVSHPIVPAPPDTPPGTIWPSPGTPSHPIATPQRFWVVAGIPGYGWRYVCVDPSLTPSPEPT